MNLLQRSVLAERASKARNNLYRSVIANNSNLYQAQEAAKLTYGKAFESALDENRRKMERLAIEKAHEDAREPSAPSRSAEGAPALTKVESEIKREPEINVLSNNEVGKQSFPLINDQVLRMISKNIKARDRFLGISNSNNINEPFYFGIAEDLHFLQRENIFNDEQNRGMNQILTNAYILLLPEEDEYKDRIRFFEYELPLTKELLEILCFDVIKDNETNNQYFEIINQLFGSFFRELTNKQNIPLVKEALKKWSKNSKFKNIISENYGLRAYYSQRNKNNNASVKKKSGKGLDNEIKRLQLIKASQMAGNTSGKDELKRILKNLVKHKIMDKDSAEKILL